MAWDHALRLLHVPAWSTVMVTWLTFQVLAHPDGPPQPNSTRSDVLANAQAFSSLSSAPDQHELHDPPPDRLGDPPASSSVSLPGSMGATTTLISPTSLPSTPSSTHRYRAPVPGNVTFTEDPVTGFRIWHDSRADNWPMMRDQATDIIECNLRYMVRDGDSATAGEIAHQLWEMFEAPCGDSMVDWCYSQAARPARDVCARYARRHRPRDGTDLDEAETDLLHRLEKGVYEAAASNARGIRRMQEYFEQRRARRAAASPPVTPTLSRNTRRRLEPDEGGDDAELDTEGDVNSLVGTSQRSSRTPRTTRPNRPDRPRSRTPTVTEVTESTVWLTPHGALHTDPGAPSSTAGPVDTTEAIAEWLQLLGFTDDSGVSLPTTVPEHMQRAVQTALTSMCPRARGLMQRSLPQCLNYIQDELIQLIETGIPPPPTAPRPRPSARPSSAPARPSSGASSSARPPPTTAADSDMVEVIAEYDETDEELLMQVGMRVKGESAGHDDACLVQRGIPLPPHRDLPHADPPAPDNEGDITGPPEQVPASPRSRSRSPASTSGEEAEPPAEAQRWLEGAQLRLALLRNCGGGNGGLVRVFRGLVSNRDSPSYEAYARPFVRWLSRGITNPYGDDHADDLVWASWVENLLWLDWVALRIPPPGTPRRQVGIFEAVDGIRAGTNTYRVLRETPLDEAIILPEDVDSENAIYSETDLPMPLIELLFADLFMPLHSSGLMETSLATRRASPVDGLSSVLQGVDFRLSQTEVMARVRRALTLLHRLRHYYDISGGRCGLPAAAEGVEALLTAHAVADGGDETVTEPGNEDTSFIEQWWVAYEDSELRAWQADAKSMMDFWDDAERRHQNELENSRRAREWDDWALFDELMAPPARKRRRVVVRVHEPSSGASSSHELPLPPGGVIHLEVHTGEQAAGEPGGRTSDSDTTTIRAAPLTTVGDRDTWAHGQLRGDDRDTVLDLPDSGEGVLSELGVSPLEVPVMPDQSMWGHGDGGEQRNAAAVEHRDDAEGGSVCDDGGI
ncbi:Ank3 [Symbiodinium sp. CCMP2592]|nr:Ank3 [Symbiodinium sp. CCMP2592]